MKMEKTDQKARTQRPERVGTGVPALDEMLGGGFPRESLILLTGSAGSGKTTFCLHFMAEGIKKGEPCVYVSLGESRRQFIENARRFGFDLESPNFHFFEYLTTQKAHAAGPFQDFLNLVVKAKAKRLVIDSISAMIDSMGGQSEARSAMHVIFETVVKRMGVTAILIGETGIGRSESNSDFTHFVADGVILVKLEHDPRTGRYNRQLLLEKMRGAAVGDATLPFTLGDAGVIPFRRFNSFFPNKAYMTKMSTGVKGLDEMMSGGLFSGSTVLLKGATGTGKTNLATTFVNEGLKRGERCLYITNEDTVAELKKGAGLLGLDEVARGSDRLRMETIDTEAMEMYELAAKVHQMVVEFKPQRLVFDGISGLSPAFTNQEIKYLVKMLRGLSKETGMATVMTNTIAIIGALENPDEAISSWFDVMLILRNFELDGAMARSMVLIKMRRSQHDRTIHEFEILPNKGMVVKGGFKGVENILLGSAKRAQTVAEFRLEEKDIAAKERRERAARKTEFEKRKTAKT
jgi:circadian clock protein KaiC